MSRRGDCDDHAVMERWFSTVKSELGERFESYGQAKEPSFDDIEVFDNQQRRHSTWRDVSPAEDERAERVRAASFIRLPKRIKPTVSSKERAMPKIFTWSEFLRRFRCPGDDGDVRAYRAKGDGVTEDHHAIQKVLGVGAAALLLLGGASAPADGSGTTTYRFTTVLDSQRDGLEATRCAAINTFGTVAVQVRDDALGINKLVTKRGAHDTPAVVAHFPTFCDNGFTSIPSDPSNNEKGEVAFQGNPRRLTTRADCDTVEQRRRRQGVFLGKGGPLTTIAHTINLPGGDFIAEFLVADQSVNTVGKVAFVPELDVTFDQGLFVGSKTGTFEQRYLADVPTGGFTFNGTSSRVSLNEVGQIAFQDTLQGSFTQGIFLSNANSTFTTIVDNTGQFASVSDPSLNIFVRVAFHADRFDALGRQIFSINTSRGGPVTTVAESNPDPLAAGPVYSSFREPSLNDLGRVAFTADILVDPTVFVTTQGVFSGPDPVADKVLQVGDMIEGVPVTSVVTCSEALNNGGQIVMTVQSENPDTFEVRTFIVTATPSHMHDPVSLEPSQLNRSYVCYLLYASEEAVMLRRIRDRICPNVRRMLLRRP